MKYETPELTALAPGLNAIQSSASPKNQQIMGDAPFLYEHVAAYQDWE
jgi:hypothetical protein